MVEENTTDDDTRSKHSTNENFTDPIFETELAQFKLRLAQTIVPVSSATMSHQLTTGVIKRRKMLPNISPKWLGSVKQALLNKTSVVTDFSISPEKCSGKQAMFINQNNDEDFNCSDAKDY